MGAESRFSAEGPVGGGARRASARRLRTLLALGALLAALMPGGAWASTHKLPPISTARAFSLPSAKRCVGGRALSFRVLTLRGVKWVGATVKVNGRRFKTIGRGGLSRAVKLTGLPAGRFVLSITARASDGRSVTVQRTYVTCVKQKPAPARAAPGSYSGFDSQGFSVGFYVATNSTSVQDVTVSHVTLACTNGTTMSDANFSIAQATIATDGSFTGTSTQTTATQTITYTLAGHFHGLDTSGNTRAAGQLIETINFTTGTSYTCTSHNLSWSTTR